MIFMYSGFSDDFKEDIRTFLTVSNGFVNHVALLLQGGPGYEHYLDSYIEPMKHFGVNKIDVVVPPSGKDEIDKKSIDIIKNAESIFIGGGYTQRYIELYAIDEIIEILKNKNICGVNIGGLSAGSLLMNDTIKSDGKLLRGLGLVQNMYIYPHFEEETYAFSFIKHAMENKDDNCYGIETNAYLEIDIEGKIKKRGNGKVYKASNIGARKIEVIEILP